jgi:hypothetical protein
MSCSQRTSRRLVRVAAVSAAVVVGGSVIGAGPAQAESASLTYTCVVLGGNQTFTSVLDTNAPATLPVGKTVDTITSANVTVPASLAGLLSAIGAATFSGTATATGYTDGLAQTIEMEVPSTPVPASGDMVVPSSGPSGSITGQHAGDVITLSGGDFTSTLDFLKSDGTPLLTDQAIPCTLDPDQDATVDTVQVVKASSTSAASAHYKKRLKQVNAFSKVRGAYGNDPSGKVSFVLKKGKHQVAAKSARLNAANAAQVTFRRISKPGTYTVTTTYAGNTDLNGSKAKTTFTVPR